MRTSGIHEAKQRSRDSSVALRNVELTLGSAAGDVNILRGVDLDIPSGGRVAIVGPSGSGKSTLMMICAGLERPTSGSVTVAGKELTGLDEDALAQFRRDHIGIVFQQFHLIPTMTALENTAIPLEFAGHKDAFKRAEYALEQVGLGHRLAHYPGQLSGGEQQRCGVARAFAGEPRLLLADEPTGNLDGATGQQIVDLMFDLSQRKHTTLMLITHDHQLAARCDRAVRLVDGLIETAGPDEPAGDGRVVPLRQR